MAAATYPQNYNDLVEELKRIVEDNTEEYTGDIVNIISRAQDQAVMDLDLELFKDVVADSTDISEPLLEKPENSILVRWIYVPSRNAFVERRTPTLCKLYGGAGLPKFFAEHDANFLFLAPAPDQEYQIEIGVMIRPEPLGGSVQTNWLTDNVPDLLLFACLVQSEQYLVGDVPRVNDWKAEYAGRLALYKDQFAGTERKDRVERGSTQPPKPAA